MAARESSARKIEATLAANFDKKMSLKVWHAIVMATNQTVGRKTMT
jgi:hypothetical protein